MAYRMAQAGALQPDVTTLVAYYGSDQVNWEHGYRAQGHKGIASGPCYHMAYRISSSSLGQIGRVADNTRSQKVAVFWQSWQGCPMVFTRHVSEMWSQRQWIMTGSRTSSIVNHTIWCNLLLDKIQKEDNGQLGWNWWSLKKQHH
jgi:hypothetical protein